ncbi:MAG: selenocysteine-specific translation elongation factor [Proteobacteria bacterium]|nr:selenocysteine-specific translation elongation factor [Pseudomonadota bacterium]
MIVGTAGHIDHGKTSLVRALTGVDTDRLPEEKARGISIALGYAYATIGGRRIGFIDVPGHERFVHTMLAGASGIGHALLVVAADDGVMPQTREHLAILDLLGIGDGVVAITKADRVPARRVDAVAAEVANLLAPTPLAGAPIIAVNALDPADPGIVALRERLCDAAGRAPPPPVDRFFRLAVDRSFALPGQGTIVTGTVHAGRVAPGDPLTLLPQGLAVRVRGIHAQGSAAAAGDAGQRCALNLAGVAHEAIGRGDWVADARALAVTTRIDAQLRLLAGEVPLEGYRPVHVHVAATHVTGHVLPLEGAAVAPGAPGCVQLVLDRAVAVAPGDRYVLRDAGATHTFGGGILLDPAAPARRRRTAARREIRAALVTWFRSGDLAPLLASSPWGLDAPTVERIAGRSLAAIARPHDAIELAAGGEQRHAHWIGSVHWSGHGEALLVALAQFHERHPDEPGPDVARLRRIAAPAAPEAVWRALVAGLVDAGRVRLRGAWLQLPAHAAAIAEAERVAADRLLPLLGAGRFDPPWARDLARALGEPEGRVRQLLAILGREGRAYAVVPDLYYDREVIGELAAIVARLAVANGAAGAAAFRDETGLGRKRAIQILEFFDRVGYTRRVGDGHVPRGAGWSAGS